MNTQPAETLSSALTQVLVQKRGNRGKEPVHFDKITARLARLATGLQIRPEIIAQRTINRIYPNIRTSKIDQLSADVADELKAVVLDCGILAARILVSDLHKSTPAKFSECLVRQSTAITYHDWMLRFVANHADALDAMIVHKRDELYNYNAIKRLQETCLVKLPSQVTDEAGKLLYETLDHSLRLSEDQVAEHTSDADNCNHAKTASCIHRWWTTKAAPQQPLVPIREDIVCDRPQYMLMRQAVTFYAPTDCECNGTVDEKCRVALESVQRVYNDISMHRYTHASPTLFHAGKARGQMSSCFLEGTADTTEDIMHSATSAARISAASGGIGIHMHNIRPAGSDIRGGGKTLGVVRQIRIYDAIAGTFNQGGKRPAAIAVFLEPWHGDILDFLQLKLPQGADMSRARNLFYALWMNDLFIRRWKENKPWSLFSAHTAPGLSALYDGMRVCSKCNWSPNPDYARWHSRPTSEHEKCEHTLVRKDAFTEKYEQYERQGLALQKIEPKTIVDAWAHSVRETGIPYICSKDTVNRCSNHDNIGTIQSSNLCVEVMQYSSPQSYGVCILANIRCPAYVCLASTREIALAGPAAIELDRTTSYWYGAYTTVATKSCPVGTHIDQVPVHERFELIDFKEMHRCVTNIVDNLNSLIDRNHYPTPECEKNARETRSIAMGVQGLADVFMLLRLPFEGVVSERIDYAITETLYHGGVTRSAQLARRDGSYPLFEGSPASRGELHFEMWSDNRKRIGADHEIPFSGLYDWDAVKPEMMQGMRNSLLVGLAPTVSTSQLLGSTDCFEPTTRHVYTRNGNSGKIAVVNHYLIRHLIELGLWSVDLYNRIDAANGSVQNIDLPPEIEQTYAIVYEIKQRYLISRAAKRGAFVDQSQSFNVYLRDNGDGFIKGVLKAGFDEGMKTPSYYINTLTSSDARKVDAGLADVANTLTSAMNAPADDTADVCYPGCESCSG
jgi:ribonucleoside-diphosphate reductase alpha subunit